MKFILLTGVVIGLAVTGSRAEAYVSFCSPPSPPSLYSKPERPQKPTMPYCANSYTGKNTCSDWEIRNYNDSVERYNNAIERYKSERRDYIEALKRYLNDADKYALCEARSLDE